MGWNGSLMPPQWMGIFQSHHAVSRPRFPSMNERRASTVSSLCIFAMFCFFWAKQYLHPWLHPL